MNSQPSPVQAMKWVQVLSDNNSRMNCHSWMGPVGVNPGPVPPDVVPPPPGGRDNGGGGGSELDPYPAGIGVRGGGEGREDGTCTQIGK